MCVEAEHAVGIERIVDPIGIWYRVFFCIIKVKIVINAYIKDKLLRCKYVSICPIGIIWFVKALGKWKNESRQLFCRAGRDLARLDGGLTPLTVCTCLENHHYLLCHWRIAIRKMSINYGKCAYRQIMHKLEVGYRDDSIIYIYGINIYLHFILTLCSL